MQYDSMSKKVQILRFIPFRKTDIVEMCIDEGSLIPSDCLLFRGFCQKLQNIYHFQHHEILESFKNSYAPKDPDADTRKIDLPAAHSEPEEDLSVQLENLLKKANYEKLSEADLNNALCQESIFKIKLKVDFEDFGEVLLYFRGESIKEETVKKWAGLKSESIQFVNYDRVLVYIKFADEFSSHKAALRQYRPGSTLLKLFQHVPKADLEMLFPNTKLQMRLVDKLMIGVPAVVSGGVVLATKLGATLILVGSLLGFWVGMHAQPVELDKAALVTLLVGFGTLGAYLWKQFNNIKNRKLHFMQTLTKSLYFKNLDNNAGVFHRLLDEAEEEECKEAILAYYFLLKHNQPISQQDLDASIETWFEERWHYALNFEIEDAVYKLEKLGLVVQENGFLKAIALKDAKQQLNHYWSEIMSKESF